MQSTGALKRAPERDSELLERSAEGPPKVFKSGLMSTGACEKPPDRQGNTQKITGEKFPKDHRGPGMVNFLPVQVEKLVSGIVSI